MPIRSLDDFRARFRFWKTTKHSLEYQSEKVRTENQMRSKIYKRTLRKSQNPKRWSSNRERKAYQICSSVWKTGKPKVKFFFASLLLIDKSEQKIRKFKSGSICRSSDISGRSLYRKLYRKWSQKWDRKRESWRNDLNKPKFLQVLFGSTSWGRGETLHLLIRGHPPWRLRWKIETGSRKGRRISWQTKPRNGKRKDKSENRANT